MSRDKRVVVGLKHSIRGRRGVGWADRRLARCALRAMSQRRRRPTERFGYARASCPRRRADHANGPDTAARSEIHPGRRRRRPAAAAADRRSRRHAVRRRACRPARPDRPRPRRSAGHARGAGQAGQRSRAAAAPARRGPSCRPPRDAGLAVARFAAVGRLGHRRPRQPGRAPRERGRHAAPSVWSAICTGAPTSSSSVPTIRSRSTWRSACSSRCESRT